MGAQSAITTLTRTTCVAGGVFAPGHLGELTRQLPFELVDAVLAETGRVEQRLRDLPARVGVYFVLALGLFPQVGYARVWDKLVAGLRGVMSVAMPTEKALRDLRRRVGVAPLRALFEVIAGPVAQPHTPGVRYRRYRTVAFDGCSSIRVPDATRNRSWLVKLRDRLVGTAGYPTVMLMALVETGTRALLGAGFGPTSAGGETYYASKLLGLLGPDMLLLTDRGFDSGEFFKAVAATKAQYLARITDSRRPAVLTPLPDGSFLSIIAGIQVRVIDAIVTVTTSTGVLVTGRCRLVTTLLDHRTDPAATLIRLYHERWEIESTFYALRHTILRGHVLRSTDPVGLQQELWALLTVYQALRMTMIDAVETRPTTDPDRASFTIALEHARNQVTNTANLLPDPTDPLGVIGQALLTNLMDPRRARISIRKVKAPASRYPTRPTGDQRPDTSTPVLATTITIQPHQHTPPPPTRYRREHPNEAPTSRRERVLNLLRAQPDQAWHARDIGQHLNLRNQNSCRIQLAQWARQGLIRRTKPSTYTIA